MLSAAWNGATRLRDTVRTSTMSDARTTVHARVVGHVLEPVRYNSWPMMNSRSAILFLLSSRTNLDCFSFLLFTYAFNKFSFSC